MNTGIILPNLSASQLVEEVLQITEKEKGFYTLYLENVTQPYRPVRSPIMNVSETVFFSGKLIATTLFSAQYILHSLQNVDKKYYVYDMEWLRGRNNFIDNMKILRNPELSLYTRSEEYAQLIKNYCNRDVKVCTIGELIVRN